MKPLSLSVFIRGRTALITLFLVAAVPAHAQLWSASDGFYLSGTTGNGQLINFINRTDPDVDPRKAVLQQAQNAVRITSATLVSADRGLGEVTLRVEGDVCVRVITEGALDNYNGAMRISVTAENKFRGSLRQTQTVTLTSIQGASPSGGSCSTPDPPVAGAVSATMAEDSSGAFIDVIAQATDQDENPLTFSTYQLTGAQATKGTVSSQNGRGFTFVPAPNFSGTVTIPYAISDGTFGGTIGPAQSWENVVTINVTGAPDRPVANPDTVTTAFGTPVSINVLANDTDADGDTLSILSVAVTPGEGAAQIQNGQILYTPPSTFSGTAHLTYQLSDGSGSETSVTGNVQIQVTPRGSESVPPSISIQGGPNITVADTNHAAGENVTINAPATNPNDGTLTWTWVIDDGSPTTTQTGVRQVALADGSHSVVVTVSDGQLSASATATVVVQAATANSPPVVTVATLSGPTSIPDSDGTNGESVQFRATASDSDGTIDASSYRWSVNSTAVASANGQATATLALANGNSTVTVTVADVSGAASTASVQVTVDAPLPTLQSVAATPAQAAVGAAVDNLCPRLNANAETLTGDAPDLLALCNQIIGNSSNPDQQRQALQALTGDELKAAQTASLNFGKLQASNITSRLAALRQGARGVSLTGLNLSYKGEAVPLQQINQAAKAIGFRGFGPDEDEKEVRNSRGGASGDEGDLRDRRLGLFVNGKIGFGDRDTTANETGYDYDSIGATAGADYRFRDFLVAGGAVGYSHSKADFNEDAGELKSRALSGTIFSSLYRGAGYLDLLASYGKVKYDSDRHIQFGLGSQVIDRIASGDTDGNMTTLGLSFGYDFGHGGWVITPNGSVTYMKVKVDGFTESGAQGLDLEYGDQSAHSTKYEAGLQFGYRYSARWGVLTPQVFGSFVHDEQSLNAVFLRFANDPFASSPGQPNTGTTFLVTGDAPDEEYARLGASLSAVFANYVSAFVNYESYAGMRNTTYSEVTLGVRVQRNW